MAEIEDPEEWLRAKREREERIMERFCRGVNLFRHDRGRDGAQDIFDAIGLLLGYWRDYSDSHNETRKRLENIEAKQDEILRLVRSIEEDRDGNR